MRHSTLLATLLTLTSLSAAWPWQASYEGLRDVQAMDYHLFRRQDESSTPPSDEPTDSGDGEETPTPTDSPSETSDEDSTEPTPTDDEEEDSPSSTDESATITGSEDDEPRETSRSTRSGSRGTRTSDEDDDKDKKTKFDPRLPAGGVSMVTPAAISGPQYYKIGDYVTFGWNYTSLKVTPTAIDVIVSCSANQATYTLATNQTVEESGKVVWDTFEEQATATDPLLTSTYTLIIYDAEGGIDTKPEAGYLGTFNQFVFGMYTPRAYTPLGEYQCATCSSALSAFERQTLGFLFVMSTITVLSFTWFANGFGVF